MDEFDGLLIGAVGVLIGVFLIVIPMGFVDEHGILFSDDTFVRVDAEPLEDWCEEWVCEEYIDPVCLGFESWGHWAESPYSGELEFYCCNQPRNTDYVPNCYLTSENKVCVYRSRVWRRC